MGANPNLSGVLAPRALGASLLRVRARFLKRATQYPSLRAPIAQLVELRTFNPQVLGSSPSGGTTNDASLSVQHRRYNTPRRLTDHCRGCRGRPR